jgi:ABC-type multidrug transport system permease subunit
VNTLTGMANTRRSPLLPISLTLFGVGLLAIIAIFALFAAGRTNLPVWLNIAALLCPAGLIFGVLASIARARRDRG